MTVQLASMTLGHADIARNIYLFDDANLRLLLSGHIDLLTVSINRTMTALTYPLFLRYNHWFTIAHGWYLCIHKRVIFSSLYPWLTT